MGSNAGPWGAPHPVRPRLTARATYRIAPLVRPNPVYRRLATWLERAPRVLRLFTAAERRSKQSLFGCRMCGQCALPATAYACPMTCPKQLRNGPCGGVAPNGDCEVHPGERCVWLIAYERAEASGHVADLALLHRPVDQRLRGTSSWVNYWLGRDEGLWTDGRTDDWTDGRTDGRTDGTASARPPLHHAPVDLGMPRVAR